MLTYEETDSHPMSVFISAFAAMGAFTPDANPSLQGRNLYMSDKFTMNKNIIRIIGKAGTVAAASMRVRMNRPFIAPKSDMSYTENILYMMDAISGAEDYIPDMRLAKALDVLFILHADHEMNCSTATMTHVGSSMVDPYVSVTLIYLQSRILNINTTSLSSLPSLQPQPLSMVLYTVVPTKLSFE